MSNDALIDSIRSGNEKALAEVYKTYRKEFIGWAIKTYHCPEEVAKDAYQNAILVFYDNICESRVL